MSEYLVGSPAFKAGDTGDPRMAGSIPVHLRQFVVVLAVCVGMIVALANPTMGAARLLESEPSDGESLVELDVVELEFDTLLLSDGAQITVTRRDGTPFSVADAVVDGAVLRAEVLDVLPSGNYAIDFDVQSADGARNNGTLRISIDAPGQAFGGGLIAVVVLAAAMGAFALLVFRADKRRRPRLR